MFVRSRPGLALVFVQSRPRLALVFVRSGPGLALVFVRSRPGLPLALVLGLFPGYTSAKAKTGGARVGSGWGGLIGWVDRVS